METLRPVAKLDFWEISGIRGGFPNAFFIHGGGTMDGKSEAEGRRMQNFVHQFGPFGDAP